MSEQTFAVEILNVTKNFRNSFQRQPTRVVDNVTIKIATGQVYGLIGPNGAGKSTIMKMLLGLVAPSAGECKIFGQNSLLTDSRDAVGFLPENPYFYKHLSGIETLRFYGRLCGLGGKQLERKIGELLNLVDLERAAKLQVGKYSKGMLQRIGLAQALIHEPKLVIFDEPTAGVDPIGSRQIRDLILDLRQKGITVFLCSHLLEQLQEICDYVGIIYKGRIICEGKLQELIAIEEQTEFVLQNASPEIEKQLIDFVKKFDGVKLLRHGKPQTTLEQLFLSKIKQETKHE